MPQTDTINIPRPSVGDALSTVGGGTALVLTYVVLIPGVSPLLVLLAATVAVLVIPVVVLGLAAGLLVAPPLALWRLATRARRRRRSEPGHPRERTSVSPPGELRTARADRALWRPGDAR